MDGSPERQEMKSEAANAGSVEEDAAVAVGDDSNSKFLIARSARPLRPCWALSKAIGSSAPTLIERGGQPDACALRACGLY